MFNFDLLQPTRVFWSPQPQESNTLFQYPHFSWCDPQFYFNFWLMISFEIVADRGTRLLLQHRHVPGHFCWQNRNARIQCSLATRSLQLKYTKTPSTQLCENLWIACFSVINYAYMDETYSDGDGTEVWCSNHQTVSTTLFTYSDPPCKTLTCYHVNITGLCIYMSVSHSAKICLINYTNTLPYRMYFICAWFGLQRIQNILVWVECNFC
jgi:hypothetical protein